MLKSLLSNPLFSPLRVAALGVLNGILVKRNLTITSMDQTPERKAFRDLLARVRADVNMVLLDSEAYSIYAAAAETAKVPGVIAEVGVYRGGSGRIICEVKGQREFHLFDTFEGLPETGELDPKFRRGTFASSFAEVKERLAGFPNLHFHKGLFPETAAGLEDLRFSFVHIDVDLYSSTRSCLDWFYPRMNRGAVLISHDYVDAEGVRRAFAEFFSDKPECLVELTGTQVCFVKL